MKLKISFIYLLLITACLNYGCGGPVKAENESNATATPLTLHTDNENYFKIDVKETIMTWRGSSAMGSHTGYVYPTQGELKIENNQLVGGSIEVNMQTMEDDKHRSDNNLIKHLKDADFFDVEKFPTATFSINKVTMSTAEEVTITGNLTIKGIIKPVSVPAKIKVTDGIVNATARLNIDRTDWGIRYRSGKFFANLADKTISDDIEFNIKIVAKK